LGISDKPGPVKELENLEPPKDELPKSEPPKAETPTREPPKCARERPDENDDNDENRDDADRFVERRFDMKPMPDKRAFQAVARFTPTDKNPDLFRPKEAFLEFSKECHLLSFRMEFP
jgi:hypothetical protein